MADMDLANFKKNWDEYENGGLNHFGQTNLACWIGERGGMLIAEIEQTRAQRDALLVALTALVNLIDDPSNGAIVAFGGEQELERARQLIDAIDKTGGAS